MLRSVASLSTAQLVQQCQASSSPSRAAFSELVRRHHAHVDRLVYCLAPQYAKREVLTQKLWVEVYDRIHQLQVPAQFRRWLSQLTAQRVMAELKDIKLRDRASTALKRKPKWWFWCRQPVSQPPFLMVADLPEAVRTTILLRDIGGFCYETIAEITDVTVATVKTRLAQARQQLQGELPQIQQDIA